MEQGYGESNGTGNRVKETAPGGMGRAVSLFENIREGMDKMEIYVSVKGDDGASGRQGDPVRTIQKAMERMRGDTDRHTENIVHLEEGTYYIGAPLQFGPQDSGKNGNKIIYQGHGRAIISGGMRLETEWRPYRDGIYVTEVPEDADFDQLFLDGRQKTLARYPNRDPRARYFDGAAADCLAPERVKRYKNPVGGYIHAMHKALWGSFHYEIQGTDGKGNVACAGGWQNNRPAPMHDRLRFIENIFEELDAPGEWYLDKKSHLLFYMPEEGEDISHAVTEVSCLKQLLVIQGGREEKVTALEFRNLRFTHVRRTFMEPMEPLLRSDWRIYRGGAVFLENTEGIVFDHCVFQNPGGNAFIWSGYNRRGELKNSEITGAGASGVLAVGRPNAVRSPGFQYQEDENPKEKDWAKGPKTEEYPEDCVIEGNLITRIGRVEKQGAGISLSMCRRIRIRHNTIYDVPRAGINICDGTWGGHIIEKNMVFDTVKETGDHGAFNSWGRDRYWNSDYEEMSRIIGKNPALPLVDAVEPVIMEDNIFECAYGWDIDLDDGSSNYIIRRNLCLRGGIKNREGVKREVTDNILFQNTFHPHVWFENSGDVFCRNVIFSPYADIRLKGWGRLFDWNILYRKGSETPAGILQEKSGMDVHSVCAQVEFEDIAAGNFKIKNSDLTEKMGFQEAEINDCGVTDEELKKKARSPFDKRQELRLKEWAEEKRQWYRCLGMEFKPLKGWGEISVTGMYEEKGIYIKRVERDGAGWKLGFRDNDVLLKIGKMECRTGEETEAQMRKMEERTFETGEKCIVWRGQREIELE